MQPKISTVILDKPKKLSSYGKKDYIRMDPHWGALIGICYSVMFCKVYDLSKNICAVHIQHISIYICTCICMLVRSYIVQYMR